MSVARHYATSPRRAESAYAGDLDSGSPEEKSQSANAKLASDESSHLSKGNKRVSEPDHGLAGKGVTTTMGTGLVFFLLVVSRDLGLSRDVRQPPTCEPTRGV